MITVQTIYQQRGYLRRHGHERMDAVMRQCATLYNAALQERRDAYRMAGVRVSLYDQMKSFTAVQSDDPAWADMDVQVGRGVLRRLDRAFNGFFRRVKAGKTPGFPRFKPGIRFRCLEIAQPRPGMVKVSADGRRACVRVKELPAITLRLKRRLPPSERLRSLRGVRRPVGLYVDLGYEAERELLPANDTSVGLDVGVNNRIATSDGEMVERREVDRARKTRLHQAVSRKRRGGNRRRKAAPTLAREQHRSRVRNRNECHRITTGIVRRYERIAVEKLTIPNMTRSASGTLEEPGTNVAAKSGLNREILTQTWGLIREQLRYKAEWAGREFVEVNPRYTSRECWSCGHQTPQSEYRTYRRGVCGTTLDRDTNAAINVMRRAFGPDATGAGISPTLSGARTIA